MPFSLAGFQVHSDQALAKQAISRAMAAVVIARGKFDRQIYHPQLFIHADLAPDTGVAGVVRGIFLPGVVAELAGTQDGVEDPEALAGSHVESADVAFDV